MGKTESKKLKVTIVTLNWNGIADTLECLLSLRKINYPHFEIIVIDNGSDDKTEATRIKQEFPKIQLIKSKKNLGFSGGNNLGIKLALKQKTDLVLLLNNDTEVKSDFLDKLAEKYSSEENIGAVAPAIFYHGTKKIWPSIGRIYPWFANVRNAKTLKEIEKLEEDKAITFFSGCALLIPSKVFKKIGLLNEDYFAYFEDTELCLKIHQAGYRLAVAPKSWIWHKVSASTEGGFSPIYIYYMTRNNLLFLRNQGLWYVWPSALIFIVYWRVIRRIARIVIKNEPRKLKKTKVIFKAISDFLKGRFGKANL